MEYYTVKICVIMFSPKFGIMKLIFIKIVFLYEDLEYGQIK